MNGVLHTIICLALLALLVALAPLVIVALIVASAWDYYHSSPGALAPPLPGANLVDGRQE